MVEFFNKIDFSYSFLGNTLEAYGVAFGIFLGLVIIFMFVQWGVLKRLEQLAKKTKTDIDDTLIGVVRSIKPSFYYILALYFGLRFLSFPELFDKVINGLLLIAVAYQVVTALHILIDYSFKKKAEHDGKDTKKAYRFLSNFIKWGLWVVAILMVLANLGINITSLVAGLGIGGIAVALALQNILTDLFSSFAIYFDKPFEIGDFIIVGEHMGTVERIGIKTTRLRALQGEELVISNKELTSARIQNFKKMKERRANFTFGVTYETPTAQVRAIPQMVRSVIESLSEEHQGLRLEYARFKSFGDSALDFETVYYVPTDDYNVYMELQEQINIALMERFEKEKIAFAYPTQTVYLSK